MNAQGINEKKAQTCPSCGGSLKYNPSEKNLKCIFCGSLCELNRTSDNIHEISLDNIDEIFNETDWGVDTKTVKCNSCGGETISTTEEKITYCAFCGSQHIAVNNTGAGVKPQGLVPYELNEEEARKKFEKWIKNSWLAPNNLKKIFKLKDLDGVYFPYWTFDTLAFSRYSVDVGYTSKDSNGKEQTTWYSKSGTYEKTFDDKLSVGSISDYNDLFKRIEPFNTTGNEIVDYDYSYLLGYKARKYTVEPHDAWDNARDGICEELKDDICRSLGGDKWKNFHQDVDYRDNTFKYIMLPIYTLVYDYKDKTYNVLINGQTGKISGSSPYSWVKISIILAGIAGLLYWLIQ